MVGITPPYLFSPVNQQDRDPSYDFDPKAVTRASYYSIASSTSTPKPKQEGPLIDFNRHPDSYIIVPSARPNVPPVHPNTKQRVNVARWCQFSLRLLQLIAGLGALICVIIIRGMNDPAVDAVVCAYALYNLQRSPRRRPAISSASYNAFSFFVDIALVPFYVFIAFFTANNWTMAPGDEGRWSTFFHSPDKDGKVLESAFLVGSVAGALHLFSIPFGIYLFSTFKKIAQYPPDMNPLEDNLTSRVNRKHTYKSSDASASMSEQRLAMLSGSSLSLSSPTRISNRDQLIPEANVRPVSFYQSRTNLDPSYSGHTQDSARQSRFEYQQPSSAHVSQTSMHRASQSHERERSRSQSSRPQSFQRYSNQRPTNRDSIHDPMPTRPLSFITASENLSRTGTPQSGHTAQKDQPAQALLNDNWFVLADDDADLSSPRRTPVPELVSDRDSSPEVREPNVTQLRFASEEYKELLPQPLRMHPPTPPEHTFDAADFYFDEMPNGTLELDDYSLRQTPSNTSIGRALSPPAPEANAVSTKSSVYSQNPDDSSRSSTPKVKRYGNLTPAISKLQEQTVPRGQGRVVSRTGVDIADSSVMYLSSDDSYGARTRNVSGKIAEEGLGGAWARKRHVSGKA
ncbi:unnamed protein product [Aureobasidium uvarum]|uniref:Uncharacterized protein n=1 Tax=Aureobasidium uvarum TaxID=2773716 RepID=A0A9N8PSX3_9PEZI|nr:unnamed protein product [Aureobasidium uvarum]